MIWWPLFNRVLITSEGLLLGFLFDSDGCVVLFGCQRNITGFTAWKGHGQYLIFQKLGLCCTLEYLLWTPDGARSSACLCGSNKNTLASVFRRILIPEQTENLKDASTHPKTHLAVGFPHLIRSLPCFCPGSLSWSCSRDWGLSLETYFSLPLFP